MNSSLNSPTSSRSLYPVIILSIISQDRSIYQRARINNIGTASVLQLLFNRPPMKLLENSPRVSEIQSRLTKYTYLSKCNLPGYPDGIVFLYLNSINVYPDSKLYSNFYHWYIVMRQFAKATINKWISDRLYEDPKDILIHKFIDTIPKFRSSPNLPTKTFSENINLSNSNTKNTSSSCENDFSYVIDILLRKYSDEQVESLRRRLKEFNRSTDKNEIEMVILRQKRQIKIKCHQRKGKCEQIANFISKSIEYHNMQIKKQKKPKTLRN